MKLVSVNTDYPQFTRWLYARHEGLADADYAEQMRRRNESLFGNADFLSENLKRLGHEAHDIYFNNERMQRAWAREHGFRVGRSTKWGVRFRHGILPQPCRRPSDRWMFNILRAQLSHFKPDVLLNLMMDNMPVSFLREMRPKVGLLVGWAEPPMMFNRQDWSIYDLILAPSEGLRDHFRSIGIKSELLRFGFEARLATTEDLRRRKSVPISFVGQLSAHHSRRTALLERVCRHFGNRVSLWAPSDAAIATDSSMKARYQGPAWGSDVYRILASSRITLNCHIDVAGASADNMRLFESTGMGTLLITDWKRNLPRMFELEREVVAYRNDDECIALIEHFLEHDDERDAVALAAQRRTLRDHTYEIRMKELIHIVARFL